MKNLLRIYGQLFIEIAPRLGDTYAWTTHKIGLKLNHTAVDQLLYSLTHQEEAIIESNSKTLTFYKGLLVLKKDDQEISHVLSPADMTGLRVLLEKAKGAIYGW